jgi:hypothetical protein
VETDFGNFRNDFLGDYDAKCKTALGCESGPEVGLIDEETEGRKSLVTVPLTG